MKTIDYPAHFESDVVLRSGRTLRIRPVRPEDADGLKRMFGNLSTESLYSRFFDLRTAEEALRYSPAEVDYVHDFGVVGEVGDEIIAVAHYFAFPRKPTTAECAFTIADRYHGLGIGTKLLEKLVEVARTRGITQFQAEVLPENQRMLDVFLGSGFDATSRSSEGTVHVTFPILPTEAAANVYAERSQKAAYASIKPIFAPHSIAVVGASRNAAQLGTQILHNLRNTGFRGSLYAVNPNATEIDLVPCFPSVRSIDGPVDLAVVAVPAKHVESVVDDCVAKGVRALVVITAGFGETGKDGREAEQRILEKVRAAGMRMVGPNCMGVLNTDANVRMHATFSGIFPPSGNVAMSSQSGALGLAILDYARTIGIGFSTFMSVGNKVDVSGNDLIQYWAEDPNTDVMLLYLESFGNPRKFGEIARRVGRKKPIVAVKAGRSASGARAASSHTGALAQSDALVRDLFKQAGVIRTDTLEELFDIASLLANQPLPIGRRVAIMTNAGGPGILAADACEASGLTIAPLSDETTAALREFLPAAAGFGNPIDMIASATPEHYARTLKLLLADPNVDSVIIIYIPVLPTDAEVVARRIREVANEPHGDKTLVATYMAAAGAPAVLAPVPSFAFPERAVNALARATSYAEWRRRPIGSVRKFDDVDADQLRAIVDRKIAAGGGWLDALDVIAMLYAARIPSALAESVTSVFDAVQAAMRMGFPVVVKALGPSLLHKTEAGAVKLNLQDEREVREAYEELQSRLGDAMTGALVQQMVPGGVEVMLGATQDPTFGHVVVFGAGGTLVEVLSDVAFRIHPLTDVDAEDIVSEVRAAKLLRGVRGAKPADVDSLLDILMRLSTLIEICPEITELDINPLKALEQGAIAVDARVKIEAIVPGPPSRRVTY
ncbi:MAG TPA: GNAT family N-acetyltransferase [Thermoanaerobaculia bacterium]|nr:GNAT family N-acetyltransferase [Thermoanaerobaculia bacterium]